jgi:hypothetical protein
MSLASTSTPCRCAFTHQVKTFESTVVCCGTSAESAQEVKNESHTPSRLQHPMYRAVCVELKPSSVARDVAHVAPSSQATKFAPAIATKLEVGSDSSL